MTFHPLRPQRPVQMARIKSPDAPGSPAPPSNSAQLFRILLKVEVGYAVLLVNEFMDQGNAIEAVFRIVEGIEHLAGIGLLRLQVEQGGHGGAGRAGRVVGRDGRVGDDELVVLCIGSGFKTKGLDRSLRAFASLPPELRARSRLIAIGDDRPTRFARLAGQLGITKRFAIWKGRDDIPQVLQGGDLLLHPAYYENTGTALLEAVVAGLPVLATATCGYAFHVEAARAGRVIGEPFAQAELVVEVLQGPGHVPVPPVGIRGHRAWAARGGGSVDR